MNNFAYNFETYENLEQSPAKKSGQVVQLPDKNKRLALKKREKFLFWFKLLTSAFLVAFVVGGFVFGQAIIAEYTNQVSVCQKNLDEIKSSTDQLEMRLVYYNFNKSDFSQKNSNSSRSVEQIVISTQDVSEIL